MASQLPSNIAAFKVDAANTNEKPLYLGRYMLLSDQDLTSLKHNLIYTCVISTTLVPLLSVVQDARIPLLIRMALLGVTFIGLHGAAIAAWNLTQSHLQLHPKTHPNYIWGVIRSRRPLLLALTLAVGLFVFVAGPMVLDAFSITATVLQAGVGQTAPVKTGH